MNRNMDTAATISGVVVAITNVVEHGVKRMRAYHAQQTVRHTIIHTNWIGGIVQISVAPYVHKAGIPPSGIECEHQAIDVHESTVIGIEDRIAHYRRVALHVQDVIVL